MNEELETLREEILMAIGAASMCWSETPVGFYDTEQAIKIANDLFTKFRELVA